MKSRLFWLALVCALSMAASAQSAAAQQTVTLYAPLDKTLNKHDDSRAWFSFADGVRGRIDGQPADKWDLGYGFLAISDEDWFMVSHGDNDRSVIKDLGELSWADSFHVPALTPLPAVEPGQHRAVTIDSSADTHKKWAATNGMFAKASVGHIYAVRIVRGATDFYALFRVEQLEQGRNCTISWKLTPAPDTSEKQ